MQKISSPFADIIEIVNDYKRPPKNHWPAHKWLQQGPKQRLASLWKIGPCGFFSNSREPFKQNIWKCLMPFQLGLLLCSFTSSGQKQNPAFLKTNLAMRKIDSLSANSRKLYMDGLYMENLIKMDDLGVPLFLETPIYDEPFHMGLSLRKTSINIYLTRGYNQPWSFGWAPIG